MEILDLIKKVKQKKEFSELPDSSVEMVLNMKGIRGEDDETKIKKTRAFLRKVFTAFFTNKILKQKITDEEILKVHYSTRHRDHEKIYSRILKNENSIVDLGAGVNGFSYGFMGGRNYVCIEAVGQAVNLMNDFFVKKKFNGKAVQGDLFDLGEVINLVGKCKKPSVIFMFNIIDALESRERHFTKKFLMSVSEVCDKIVLSFFITSLAFVDRKRKTFRAKRFWILNFINDNFEVLDDFDSDGERFIVFKGK